MKLMVAIPTLDYVHFDFTRCLVGLTKRLCEIGVDFDVCFNGGTLVYLSRDALAADAVNQGYTHVLWLDADMIFNADAFEKLLANGKDVVSGVYQSRHSPYKSTVYTSLQPEHTVKNYPKELLEAEGCGFGIVLTTTATLRDVFKANGTCFQPIEGFGEDLSFCIRSRKLEHGIYCDPNVVAGHIGHVVIWPESN